MLLLAEILLSLVSAVFFLPALVLSAEILSTLRYRPAPLGRAARRPRTAVLMPAHDEASGIARSLATLLPQLGPEDRLVVIADNCSDDTAAIAARAGAEVIERRDASKRGKGFALDFGIRHLEQDPPEIVIIADADCEFAAGAVEQLAVEAHGRGRPIQALYLMLSHEDAGTKTRIAQFAWLVKNQARPTGLLAWDLPCQLMGTGMAFPWAGIRCAHLATGHIVEDVKLGLELLERGEAPCFRPEILVTSYFPRADEGIRSQRTRWEHGHIGLIVSEAPRLLIAGVRKLDAGRLALALDLTVPPLALLVLLAVLDALIDSAFAAAHGGLVPLWVAGATLTLIGTAVLLAWFKYGRQVVSFATLASVPLYALRKIPIYVGFVLSRQLEWVRSKRDP